MNKYVLYNSSTDQFIEICPQMEHLDDEIKELGLILERYIEHGKINKHGVQLNHYKLFRLEEVKFKVKQDIKVTIV